MNIKVIYSWLKEYIETNVSAEKLAEYLSLCGPSVERIEKIKGEEIFDIEITSNRIDSASVLGIAQEVNAILPGFGEKVKMKDKFKDFKYSEFKEKINKTFSKEPEIKVFYPAVSRYIAVILDNVQISNSPDFIKKRLELCGVKSINNVVDISNYVMLELGQPNHIFDWDRLYGKLVLKKAKKGEKIKLLDERKISLEEGDLIFIDGKGNPTDFCGIMGGYLSEVRDETKKILVTIPVYDKRLIRRTSMRTAIRTLAATYFEKGLPEERTEIALKLLLDLLQKYAGAKILSKIFDYYPKRFIPQKIEFTLSELNNFIGVDIPKQKVISILERLGFQVQEKENQFVVVPPYWRKYDIENVNDIVEEVARIYGYFKLPSNLQPILLLEQPVEIEKLFKYQIEFKKFLKHIGFTEILNYSMTSEELVEKYIPKEKDNLLKLKNPISQLLVYMRNYLFPSLAQNIEENKPKFDTLKIFELAKVYEKIKGDLPKETYHLALATTEDFYFLKGVIEGIFEEFNIEDYEFEKSNLYFLDTEVQAKIFVNKDEIGFIGKLKDKEWIVAEINFEKLISYTKPLKTFKPLPKYSIIKLDYNFALSQDLNYQKIKQTAFNISKFLYKIEVVDLFKNKLTLRFYFTDFERNINEEEAKEQLRKILKKLALPINF